MSKDHKEIKEMKDSKEMHGEDVEMSSDQEINYDLIETGPLYIDPRHKKPGFVYHFIADEPGEIEKRLRRGFHIVQDEINVGTDHASSTSRFGSAVTVKSKCGRLLVLMACTEDNFNKFMAHLEKKNRERSAALGQGRIDGVPEHLQQLNGESLGGMKITRK